MGILKYIFRLLFPILQYLLWNMKSYSRIVLLEQESVIQKSIPKYEKSYSEIGILKVYRTKFLFFTPHPIHICSTLFLHPLPPQCPPTPPSPSPHSFVC